MKLKYIFLTITAYIAFVMGGCTEKFLDINTDPNNPVAVPINQLLPTVQIDVAGVVGTSIGNLGGYSSNLVHHMFQRGDTHQFYNLTGNDFEVGTVWDIVYPRILTDIRQIIALGTEMEGEEDWHYVGMAKILRAYIYSIMVDFFADIPFSEANLGSEVRAPKFDNGEDIYPQLFDMIDEGIADLGKDSRLSPTSDDLFYGGNLTKWIKFANTLKLKMYNQIRLVENVSGPVNQLISNPNLLIGPGDDFEFQYGASGSPMNRNPGYQQEYAPGGMYYYINPYFYEILTGQNTFFPEEWNPYIGIRDPRIPYYFYNQLRPGQAAENPTAYKDGEFVSIYMFSFNIDPNEGFDQASSQTVAGLYPLGGKYDDGQGGVTNYNGAGDTPQRILTYMDHLYIRAELAIAGVTSEDPRALLEAAVNESFRKVDEVAATASAPALDPALIESYKTRLFDLYDNADEEGQLQHIMTQKWIAKFGSAFDSYTDYRRTGYPILQDGNADFLNVTAQTRAYPLSYPWSTDELQVNPNAPSQKQITQYPVFWDVN